VIRFVPNLWVATRAPPGCETEIVPVVTTFSIPS